MKYLSLNISRKSRLYISNESLCKEEFDFDELVSRVIRVLGKPNYAFKYVRDYLLGACPYQKLESDCYFTPADIRSLRNLKSFITYVENHGRMAPIAHVFINLNTGDNIYLENTSWHAKVQSEWLLIKLDPQIYSSPVSKEVVDLLVPQEWLNNQRKLDDSIPG